MVILTTGTELRIHCYRSQTDRNYYNWWTRGQQGKYCSMQRTQIRPAHPLCATDKCMACRDFLCVTVFLPKNFPWSYRQQLVKAKNKPDTSFVILTPDGMAIGSQAASLYSYAPWAPAGGQSDAYWLQWTMGETWSGSGSSMSTWGDASLSLRLGSCSNRHCILSPCYWIFRKGKLICLYTFLAKAQSLCP